MESRSAYSIRACSTSSLVLAMAASRASGEVEQEQQERLLRVEPVLGLIPHHRMRSVDHLGGDLLAAVRGQAVHDDHAVAGDLDELLVELVALEHKRALVGLGLPSHA